MTRINHDALRQMLYEEDVRMSDTLISHHGRDDRAESENTIIDIIIFRQSGKGDELRWGIRLNGMSWVVFKANEKKLQHWKVA